MNFVTIRLDGTAGSIQTETPSSGERKERSTAPSADPALRRSAHGGTQRSASAAIMNADPPEDADARMDFDAIVVQYEKRIFNLIYRIMGDYEEASDLTQETFINAYRHYDRFRGDAKVFTWLYQIARNLCINRLRQRDRQKAIRTDSLDRPMGDDEEIYASREVADWRQSPHQVLEERELQQKIAAAIEALPQDYKEVVMLREIEQLSYNEIVEATGLSLENVKTRLSRARAMLRRKLEPYYRMD